MTFQEIPYTRPDYQAYEKNFTQLVETLNQADEVETALHAVTKINALRSQLDTMVNVALIRHSVNTLDEFYTKEDEYFNEYLPLFEKLDADYYDALLKSDFQEALRAVFPETLFLIAEGKAKIFSPEIIPLLQKENELISQYGKLNAEAEIFFEGKNRTLSEMTPFTKTKDRHTRKLAQEAITHHFVKNEEEFDRIYDELVTLRNDIALKLGFKDYVDYSYVKMNRWGYDRVAVETYRKNILKDVVPVVEKLHQRQKERLTLDELFYYDLPLVFPNGNATPKGTPDELVENAKKMYQNLSKETGEFFDFMVENNLLDLLSKKGKEQGGYCTFLMEEGAPFIFANFNGTSGDVDVLTHEAGHAFQAYSSSWIKEPELIFPSNEAAEIHSMSMEFLTWPYMELFFQEETKKYQFNHLASAVEFLPYGVLVDHFQQVVYENPSWSPKERKDAWRKLEKMYLPGKNYATSELERGIYWFRQGHIFGSPFYYIDYTLAQVCAFQFWKRSIVDQDETYWEDYLNICKVGGSKTFLEICELGHLVSPFKEGSLKEIIATIEDYLASISEEELK